MHFHMNQRASYEMNHGCFQMEVVSVLDTDTPSVLENMYPRSIHNIIIIIFFLVSEISDTIKSTYPNFYYIRI